MLRNNVNQISFKAVVRCEINKVIIRQNVCCLTYFLVVYTPYLKKRMHDRDILKLKASRSKDANDWLQFKKCRNLVNNEIKKAKELY